MKRILTIVLLIIMFVSAVTVLFIILGGQRFANQEKDLTDFLLASLELIGLVVSFVIVVFILYQYIGYRHPYRLVFEAFSNESALVNNESKPLNLSILAKEELVHQFKIIYHEIRIYKKQLDKRSQDLEAQVADVPFSEEDLLGNNLGMYVSIDQIKKSRMIEDLEDVFRILTDPEDINLMNLVGEIAPKEVTPVMKFIEAIFPPHVIRATGHLQCKSDKSGRVGMTFEFVDLGSQRNLMVRTLRWQSSDNIEDSADTTPPAKSSTANETLTNKGTDYYIDLLSPAMYWVAIMFWEQKLISHVPLINRILKVREKRRQARILYLLGALYYAHADQFPAYSRFFFQLAVEHFRQALTKDSNWYPPYLYLANLYSFKMQEAKEEMREKLLDEALSLYEKALNYAQRTKKSLYTQYRIIIDRALAELVSDKGQLIDKAEQEVRGITVNQGLANPTNFDPKRADCPYYLYNLALWYALAEQQLLYIPDAEQKARRYLAYSLARSERLWDAIKTKEEFKNIYSEEGLEILKKELDKKLSEECELEKELGKKLNEECRLATMTGDNFKTEIDKILKMVDQKLKDQADEQRA